MVDLDRGVVMRNHPKGIRVCMYKDQPGVFVDVHDNPVGSKVAAEAGFDVTLLEKAGRKQAALEKAKADIDKEYADRNADFDRVAEAVRYGSLSVRSVGSGKYGVFDDQGERLTSRAMSKADAEELVSSITDEATGGDNGKTA